MTYQETLAIIAEAAYRTNNLALARQALDALRAEYGGSAVGAGLSGTALLTRILEEKYIAMFQNYEVLQRLEADLLPEPDAGFTGVRREHPGAVHVPDRRAHVQPGQCPGVRRAAPPKRERPGECHVGRRDGVQGAEALSDGSE